MSIKIRNQTKNPNQVIGYFDKKTEVSTAVKLTSRNSSKETLTNQSMKDHCDINLILKRFHKTGVLDHAAKHNPQYGELSTMDFETAFNNIKATEESFKRLPKEIREAFQNKPENLLAYMENEQNRTAERLLTASASRNGEPDSSNSEGNETNSSESPSDKKAAK